MVIIVINIVLYTCKLLGVDLKHSYPPKKEKDLTV